MVGASRGEVEVAGARYVVFVKGHRAEAVRTNAMGLVSERSLWVRAKLAIERVSGCAVRPGTLYGDQALVEAELDCP